MGCLRIIVADLPPARMTAKKRTSSGPGSGGGAKKIKGGDTPNVPADSLAMPHTQLFNTWAFLG